MGASSFLIPVIHVKDGEVFANSRDVADFFGKEHRNVLRDIDGLLNSEHTPSGWFIFHTVFNEQNKVAYRSYDMTKDGFTLLVMGYTGAKAGVTKHGHPPYSLPSPPGTRWSP